MAKPLVHTEPCEFTMVDEHGQVVMRGQTLDLPQRAGCHTFAEAAPANSYRDGDAWTPIPVQANPAHVFDWTAKVWKDPRTLDEIKAARWGELKRHRNLLEASGFPYRGKTLDSDSRSVQRINTAVQAAQAALAVGEPFAITWTCADNTAPGCWACPSRWRSTPTSCTRRAKPCAPRSMPLPPPYRFRPSSGRPRPFRSNDMPDNTRQIIGLEKGLVDPGTGATMHFHVLRQYSVNLYGEGSSSATYASFISHEAFKAGRNPLAHVTLQINAAPSGDSAQFPDWFAQRLLEAETPHDLSGATPVYAEPAQPASEEPTA
jgi:hypothetical protein